MGNIKNNDATQMVENKLFSYNFEDENNEFPGKDDMEKLHSLSNFFEYVSVYATRIGYIDDINDCGKLASFLTQKCAESNAEISRQTLYNWLTNGLPANTANGRENVYRLCFALHMDAQQTREFFLKAYLERPFNYKNLHEAVYFFCMNNGFTYNDAVRMIRTIDGELVIDNPYADTVTEQIGDQLSIIKSEDVFLKYIRENRSGLLVQNQTATDRISQLLADCRAVAAEEYRINYPHEKEITVDNIDDLLSIIYGYSARAVSTVKDDKGETVKNDKGKPVVKPVYKKSISKSRFPEFIRQNWPQREQFQQILDKKTASYDVIRRALIMLTFYDFSANAIVNGALDSGIFEECIDEINSVLAECGYVQLYWRNPFDWMIGYCAQAPNPLDTLRELINEYYLNDPEVYNE